MKLIKRHRHGLIKSILRNVFLSGMSCINLAFATAPSLCHLQVEKSYRFAKYHQAQVQYGAQIYNNFCAGCHSLRYLNPNQLFADFQIPVSKSTHWQRVSLPTTDAMQWFGRMPPDLSLIMREKGKAKVMAYLTGFYQDNSRPFHVNNDIIPGTSMPDVFDSWQFNANQTMSQQRLQTIEALTEFLDYVAEPTQWRRCQIGWMVMGFLMSGTIVVYLYISARRRKM